MKKTPFLLFTAAMALTSTAAMAKVNYTTRDGRPMCCTSVGPAGYEAHGCTANPGGNPCPAKMITNVPLEAIAVDRNGIEARVINQVQQQTTRPITRD